MSLRGRIDRLAALSRPGLSPASIEMKASSPRREDEPAKSPTTLDDLRARMHAILEKHARPIPPREVDTPELPFITEETPKGPLHSRTLVLGAGHRVGRAPVYAAKTADATLLGLLALDPSLVSCDPTRALYLDTETTGLAGGTGTVAFLVGLAYFAPSGALVSEQLLVRNLGEEAPMLARVAERIRDASMLVTFNGKSFDMPLLRTRFVLAKISPPKEPPHLDLLHVARRLHRRTPHEPRVGARLVAIEENVLGFVRHDDVPSGDVSACYLHFLRTGETRALLGVVEHNAWDTITMTAMLGLYGEPLAGSQLTARDLVGVARTLVRAGEKDLARETVERAVRDGAGPESLRARAEIAKAHGDRARALEDYEAFANCVEDAHVRLELAKLYEHWKKDPARALEMVHAGTSEDEARSEKRATRLRLKRDKPAPQKRAQKSRRRAKSDKMAVNGDLFAPKN